jgi:hypothetical protein
MRLRWSPLFRDCARTLQMLLHSLRRQIKIAVADDVVNDQTRTASCALRFASRAHNVANRRAAEVVKQKGNKSLNSHESGRLGDAAVCCSSRPSSALRVPDGEFYQAVTAPVCRAAETLPGAGRSRRSAGEMTVL